METRRVTGLELSESELNEATRRLAFFAPSGAAEYVQDLFTFLAEQALAAMKPGAWRAVDILAKLRKITGIVVEYEELLAGLERAAAQVQGTGVYGELVHRLERYGAASCLDEMTRPGAGSTISG
ncbi:MAG: hypothetical protein PVH50_07850 [Anaerolineae bacterium]|jgi:hypothetical protein